VAASDAAATIKSRRGSGPTQLWSRKKGLQAALFISPEAHTNGGNGATECPSFLDFPLNEIKYSIAWRWVISLQSYRLGLQHSRTVTKIKKNFHDFSRKST
jgi:hypothetical protein